MLLIDGDIVLYRCLSAAEQELQWDDDLWTLICNHADARDKAKEMIEGLLEASGQTKYTIALSCPNGNWRKDIYPEYKANRKGTRKPLGYATFREWAEGEYPCVSFPKLEADDLLGILQTKPSNIGKTIIWSLDKDLMQIPGKHLIDGEIVEVTPSEADMWFYTQALIGDPTDNYPGCPGIGKVKAGKILGDEPCWEKVRDAYLNAELTEEEALTQARVARILRWENWDTEAKEVKLWTPN